MKNMDCVAMILAGGRGKRLGALTRYYPKPAVHFGGRHRIIDFTLNNCKNSGVNTIGILSQYFSIDLHTYVHSNFACRPGDGIYMLPPQDRRSYYRGTADAVCKNIDFIERFDPEHVIILAGDHIYEMDYSKMIDFHRQTGAGVTVASVAASLDEEQRLRNLIVDPSGRVHPLGARPDFRRDDMAPMGIYVFRWDKLKRYLLADNVNEETQYDFERDILPAMTRSGELVNMYGFNDYWHDIGTVDSLLEANLDQINRVPLYYIQNNGWKLSGPYVSDMAYNAHGAEICQSIVPDGCSIFGRVEHSVLSDQVTIGKGAEIVDSYIMPGAYIGNNAKIHRTVVGTRAVVMDNVVIGDGNGSESFIDRRVCERDASLVAPWLYIEEGMKFQAGSHIYRERLDLNIASRMDAAPYYHRREGA